MHCILLLIPSLSATVIASIATSEMYSPPNPEPERYRDSNESDKCNTRPKENWILLQRITIYVSSYYCICPLTTQYMCPLTISHISARRGHMRIGFFCYACVVLLFCASSYYIAEGVVMTLLLHVSSYYMCPLTIYVSSYYIFVLLLYMCPLTIYVSSYYVCVLLLNMCPPTILSTRRGWL